MKTSHRTFAGLALASIVLLTPTLNAALINIQFGGNDYGSLPDAQSGAGLIGGSGDEWNNFTSTSALLSGVSLNDSTGAATGATLTVSAPFVYQYAVGPGGTGPTGANQLYGTAVSNLAQGELGAGGGQTLTLSFSGLAATTTFNIYLLSSPDRWERASSWSVNGDAGTTVGPLNSYTGSFANNPGWAPYVLVNGINYLVLSGTSDGFGALTLAGTGISGAEPDINGLQIQPAAIPEPSAYAAFTGGAIVIFAVWRRRRKVAA